jgi:hypothetical protein
VRGYSSRHKIGWIHDTEAGCHETPAEAPTPRVSILCPLPSARTASISYVPALSPSLDGMGLAAYAIHRPSGDQVGEISSPGAFVSGSVVPPYTSTL